MTARKDGPPHHPPWRKQGGITQTSNRYFCPFHREPGASPAVCTMPAHIRGGYSINRSGNETSTSGSGVGGLIQPLSGWFSQRHLSNLTAGKDRHLYADVAQSVEHPRNGDRCRFKSRRLHHIQRREKYTHKRVARRWAQQGNRNVYLWGPTAGSRHAAVTVWKDRQT